MGFEGLSYKIVWDGCESPSESDHLQKRRCSVLANIDVQNEQ